MSVCNIAADGMQLKNSFSVKLNKFKQGKGDSIVITPHTL